MSRTRRSIKERILKRTEYINLPDLTTCWVWTGATKEGYGVMNIRGKMNRVHRIAYRLFRGVIPYRMIICHRCDNRACWRPTHLFLGLNSDNQIDRYEKRYSRIKKLFNSEISY